VTIGLTIDQVAQVMSARAFPEKKCVGSGTDEAISVFSFFTLGIFRRSS
jgi:hypothetical protein